jgi:rSAM/selenodomain-associated transferase 1
MAKPAVPGRVKTRLIGDLTPGQAATVHQAMLDCVMARVQRHFHAAGDFALVLAAAGAMPTPPDPWRLLDQGDGNLGDRMAHVWRSLGGGPVIFLGVDSPDVPAEHFDALAASLSAGDASVGAVDDGGYWTLAARRFALELLTGIDWGTADVYDQTQRRAADAGLRLTTLPPWHDVDDFADLVALRRRLVSATDPALLQLRAALDNIDVKLQDAI